MALCKNKLHSHICPGGEMDIMTVYETVVPDSNSGWGTN